MAVFSTDSNIKKFLNHYHMNFPKATILLKMPRQCYALGGVLEHGFRADGQVRSRANVCTLPVSQEHSQVYLQTHCQYPKNRPCSLFVAYILHFTYSKTSIIQQKTYHYYILTISKLILLCSAGTGAKISCGLLYITSVCIHHGKAFQD